MHEAIDHTTPLDVLTRKEEGSEEAEPFTALTFAEVLALADWAVCNPRKWPTVKLKLRHPEWTCRELARALGLDGSTVSRHLLALRRVKGRRSAG